MPLRKLTGRERTESANWQFAALLAFIAGTVDVSGYLGLRQFTSHMSGNTASLALQVSLFNGAGVLRLGVVIASFLAGAACCAALVNWERRRNLESLYAAPVLFEAVLLTVPAWPAVHVRLLLTMSILSFSMGLQNAIITKISHAEIRTTHVTGMITDIGIELGRALYWNRNSQVAPVVCDAVHLRHLITLVGLFFVGGVAGGVLFPRAGFAIFLPLACALAVFSLLPILADIARAKVVAR